MKYGIRTPSVKRSISAKTTGRAKKAINSSVNPIYGKKGAGIINSPKKAVYNKVYNKTTVSPLEISNKNLSYSTSTKNNSSDVNIETIINNKVSTKNKWIALTLCLFLGYFGAHKFYEGKFEIGILYLFTIGLFGIGVLVDFINILRKPTMY